jgi:putative nucleotidyltransferase with HDIG domain
MNAPGNTAMIAAINVTDVRARVRALPELPRAVQEIRLALLDDDLGLDDFAGKVAIDAAIVAKLLRAANSPFYGMSGAIGSVRDAVRLIGLRSVGTLVTTAAVLHAMAPPKCVGFDFAACCDHALATAVCSQELARACGYPEGLAFTAGLLHDIGRLALATYYPREFATAIAFATRSDCLLADAENSVLGIGHAEVGAWIATHWKFAEPVSEAIRLHHRPTPSDGPEGPGGAPATLTDIVHTADGIVHALDLTPSAHSLVPPLQLAAWSRLRLANERYPAIFERTQAGFDALRDSMRGSGHGPAR